MPSGLPDATALEAAGENRPGVALSVTWRLAGTIARFAIGFVTAPILTRTLGMSQWGLLSLFQIATAPLLLLDVGFGAASVKFVAEAVGRGDRAGAVRVVHTTLLFNVLMGVAGAAALALAAPWLASSAFAVPPDQVGTATVGFRIVAVTWFLGIVSSAYLGTLTGHQRYDLASRYGALASVVTSLAGVATAWATRDVVWVISAQALMTGLLALLYRHAADRLLPGSGSLPHWDRSAFQRSARFGRWHATSVAGGMLAGWSDSYILGTFFSPVVVGFYTLPHALYIQLYGTFGEMGEVLFPAVSHREGVDDLPGARRLVLIAGWALTGAFGVCAAVVAAIGGDFLHLWISPQLARETTSVLRILCAAGIVGMAAVAPLHYVLGAGRPRWNAVSSLLVGATALGVSLAIVPRIGLPGVGYGLLAGVTTRWGVVALIWWKHFSRDVPLTRFAANVWAPPLTSLLLLAALVHVHDVLAIRPSWPWLFLEGAMAIVIAGAAQLLAGEALPGGAARRRDLIASFWPVVQAALGRRWRVERQRS